MASLDELVEKQKAYTVMVAACGATGHDFRVSGPFSAEVGKSCSKCDIAELPWLRGEVVRLTEHADALSESLDSVCEDCQDRCICSRKASKKRK